MTILMRCTFRHLFIILLIFISTTVSSSLFGQERYGFFTPKIDSICRSTLELIRIKQSLIAQQYQVDQDLLQIENTINVMNRHLEEAQSEHMAIDSELAAINRHLDSLAPKRPDGPRPKENIIDILSKRLSFDGAYGLNLNQLALSNWAAGGENTFAGKAFANFSLVYHIRTFEQKLTGNFAFGIARFADRKRVEKQDDKIDLTYALTFLTVSAGYSYKTKDECFQIYMSPLAGKVTFVMNQELADKGAFGVKKGYYDQDSLWIPGEHVAPAIGVNVIVNYKRPIYKNITYTTMLNTFYNYIERRDDDRLRLDVNWENTINFYITKYLSTILFVHLKYDHNTTFPVYETIEGVETVVDNVPKLQFKESLGIAFIHKF